MKYTRRRTCIFNLNYHIIFCPKYRKPYLWKVGKKRLARCFRQSAIKHNVVIREMEIMPDHVHIFISVLKQNTFNISKFLQSIKGWSSYSLRKQKPWLKRYKALWAPSYFCESIGHISESTIRKYIKNQTTNMKSDYKYKSMVVAMKKREINNKAYTMNSNNGVRYSGWWDQNGNKVFSFKNTLQHQRSKVSDIKESVS